MPRKNPKTSTRPAPLVPPEVHDLGPIPRSVLIRCMMGDYGVTEEEATRRVDEVLKDFEPGSYHDDSADQGPLTKGTA
jgi:hypothetical protein